MKFKNFYAGLALVSVALPIAAHARGGVEWGNGENGFSNEIPKLELPFKEPLELSERQCRLFFADGMQTPAHERFKQSDQKWCVLGEIEEWGFFKPKKRSEWACEESSKDMFLNAIKRFKLGLRCQTVHYSFKSVEEVLQVYPAPTLDGKICGSTLLSPEPIRMELRSKDHSSWMVEPIGYYSNSDWLYDLMERSTNAPAETVLSALDPYHQDGIAKWLSVGVKQWSHYRPYFSTQVKLFNLDLKDSALQAEPYDTRAELNMAKLGCGKIEQHATLQSAAVLLSENDLAAVAAMNRSLKSLPIGTVAGFRSTAELLHYRKRNQQLLAKTKDWYESLSQATTEVASTLDPRYLLEWNTIETLRDAHERFTGFYAAPEHAGKCGDSPASYWLSRIPSSSSDECFLLDQSITRIHDRIERLQFSYPNSITPYDPAGCRYVVDIASTIRDLHNRFFVFDDFPTEFYGTDYAKKIISTMKELNRLRYRKSAPGEFLESVLPKWREICQRERPEIEGILATFRKN